MSAPEKSPRQLAAAFTPQLTELIEQPLYSDVWSDPALSPRDRSLATLGAVVALVRPDELPAQLRRARDNGVTPRAALKTVTALARRMCWTPPNERLAMTWSTRCSPKR